MAQLSARCTPASDGTHLHSMCRNAAIREGRLGPAVPPDWGPAAAEAAHAASGRLLSKALLHAWPLGHQDAWAADAAWLRCMRDLGFSLDAADVSGRTLLHRAVQVRLVTQWLPTN